MMRPPHRYARYRAAGLASTRTAVWPRARQESGRRGREETISVVRPGQHVRMARRSMGESQRQMAAALAAESASNRKGPRRCLKRCSRRMATGLSGCAATPGSVAVLWATRRPWRSRRASRSSRSFSAPLGLRGGLLCTCLTQLPCQRLVMLRQHLDGKQCGICGAIDGDGRHGNAGGHHHR